MTGRLVGPERGPGPSHCGLLLHDEITLDPNACSMMDPRGPRRQGGAGRLDGRPARPATGNDPGRPPSTSGRPVRGSLSRQCLTISTPPDPTPAAPPRVRPAPAPPSSRDRSCASSPGVGLAHLVVRARDARRGGRRRGRRRGGHPGEEGGRGKGGRHHDHRRTGAHLPADRWRRPRAARSRPVRPSGSRSATIPTTGRPPVSTRPTSCTRSPSREPSPAWWRCSSARPRRWSATSVRPDSPTPASSPSSPIPCSSTPEASTRSSP